MDPFWHLGALRFGVSVPMSPGVFGCLNGYHNPLPYYLGGLGPRVDGGGFGIGHGIEGHSLCEGRSDPVRCGPGW
jgi:hypothetical protein